MFTYMEVGSYKVLENIRKLSIPSKLKKKVNYLPHKWDATSVQCLRAFILQSFKINKTSEKIILSEGLSTNPRRGSTKARGGLLKSPLHLRKASGKRSVITARLTDLTLRVKFIFFHLLVLHSLPLRPSAVSPHTCHATTTDLTENCVGTLWNL